MGLMDGKKALIFGVANKNSIAWGITEAFHKEGAKIGLSYAGEVLKKRVMPLAESIGVDFVHECDVMSDEALDGVFAKAKDYFGGTIDVLVHAIAFATREDLEGEYVNTSRQGFNLALNISTYSLVALAQRARPLMPNGGAIITLTYYGSEKVMPHYNVMGVAKAALEASVRYLAYDLGGQKIRVNAISPGPIKTLSASGIPGFRDMLHFSEQASPLHQLVTPEDVGKAALWLCSDWGRSVTAQTIYVDAGYNAMGLPLGALQAAEAKATGSTATAD
jgi:enoyl-[acyl-carrier protein] reductase I